MDADERRAEGDRPIAGAASAGSDVDRAELRAALDDLDDAILRVDASGRIRLANAATERLFGATVDALVGLPLDRFLGAAGLASTATLEGATVDAVLVRDEGLPLPVEVRMHPKSAGGARTVVVRRRSAPTGDRPPTSATARVGGLTNELRPRPSAGWTEPPSAPAWYRRHEELLANMSHELRTPLNSIIGFADLMHQRKVGPLSAEHEEYLGDILTSARSLLRLIHDLLDLARIEAGNVELRLEPVDVGRLVDDVKRVLRGPSSAKRHRVAVEIAAEVSTLVVDAARFKQVVYALLSNAIQFTGDGGEIAIRVAPSPADTFRLEVTDSGIGIPALELGAIFEALHRVDGATGRGHRRAGLGLAVVKRVVEAHGGHVEVESTEGVGSTFAVVMPRRPRTPTHER